MKFYAYKYTYIGSAVYQISSESAKDPQRFPLKYVLVFH